MAGLKELLGDSVMGKEGATVDVASLEGEGKYVGIYFSAHWCPPCRGFTPKLAEFYKSMKEGANGPNMEIVFVSSDKDQAAFDEYFGEMPWLNVPFADRDRKEALSKKFAVKGIPNLVFVDGKGEAVHMDGRAKVMADLSGASFPWV